ncbi:glycosyltransferase [Sediminibacterium sp.]|uniref:glycosyltransferase n=1 Tax=Sediminibacterium sp. TaxID=1917865 RepID=UPI0035254D29
MECDFNVVLIGRKLPNSLEIPFWPFKTIRMHMLFLTGPLFYLFFNFRLFFILLIKKADLLYANDLDTLLPNYLISKIKKLPLIYDSHELFCEVPELVNAPFKQNIWRRVEKHILPKLKFCITVNDSIAKIFEKKYGVKFVAVRNISNTIENFNPKSKGELGLPDNKKIILLQGAGINIDRGAEELLDAMRLVDNAILLIIGSGDVWTTLREKIKKNYLEEKVFLIDKIPKQELMHYTFNADLGLSIDKNTNLNYVNSLPNKIFDYIQAGVPILASRLPEIEKIINDYKIGDFIADHQPENIAFKINEMLSSDKLLEYKNNTKLAAKELNWANEKQKLISVIKSVTLKTT